MHLLNIIPNWMLWFNTIDWQNSCYKDWRSHNFIISWKVTSAVHWTLQSSVVFHMEAKWLYHIFNPLNTKPTNCLSVFDHFAGLALSNGADNFQVSAMMVEKRVPKTHRKKLDLETKTVFLWKVFLCKVLFWHSVIQSFSYVNVKWHSAMPS